MKDKNLRIFGFLLIIAAALPALIGFALSDVGQVYSGVVFNPMDGYTYLAKMQIGRSGDWLFTLPFSAQAGEGRLLFPFYIAVGHLIKLLSLPQSVGFNLLRVLSYGLLIFALYQLAEQVFSAASKLKTLAIFLMAAGGGLGWVLLPFGKFGADFWVAEAFPFLSGLANPHFPLAAGLIIAAILLPQLHAGSLQLAAMGAAALLLSILSPFGFVVAAGVLGLSWLWDRREGKLSPVWPVLAFWLAGAPYCAYQYWAVNSTPQLAAWTAQNQTPSPQAWDVILAFSPWLLLIIFGWRDLLRLADHPVVRKLIIWMAFGLILTIIPFNLQRRFMFGLSIPITCLGLLVLPFVAESLRFSRQKLKTICTILVLPTPILLLIMTGTAIAARAPLYFLQADELEAIQWIAGQNDGRSLVLAADQTGSLIPAVSRLRVIYGHPFETINADEEKDAVSRFFNGSMLPTEAKTFLSSQDIGWILYGPREKGIGQPAILADKKASKQFGLVELYHVQEIMP